MSSKKQFVKRSLMKTTPSPQSNRYEALSNMLEVDDLSSPKGTEGTSSSILSSKVSPKSLLRDSFSPSQNLQVRFTHEKRSSHYFFKSTASG